MNDPTDPCPHCDKRCGAELSSRLLCLAHEVEHDLFALSGIAQKLKDFAVDMAVTELAAERYSMLQGGTILGLFSHDGKWNGETYCGAQLDALADLLTGRVRP